MWPKLSSFYAVGDFTVCKGFDSATFLQVISPSLFKLIVTDDSWKCYFKPEPKYYFKQAFSSLYATQYRMLISLMQLLPQKFKKNKYLLLQNF